MNDSSKPILETSSFLHPAASFDVAAQDMNPLSMTEILASDDTGVSIPSTTQPTITVPNEGSTLETRSDQPDDQTLSSPSMSFS